MSILDILHTSLLDLLWELQDTGISMIIGGGYEIFLKSAYVNEHKIRTLLAERPESRSIFLRVRKVAFTEQRQRLMSVEYVQTLLLDCMPIRSMRFRHLRMAYFLLCYTAISAPAVHGNVKFFYRTHIRFS